MLNLYQVRWPEDLREVSSHWIGHFLKGTLPLQFVVSLRLFATQMWTLFSLWRASILVHWSSTKDDIYYLLVPLLNEVWATWTIWARVSPLCFVSVLWKTSRAFQVLIYLSTLCQFVEVDNDFTVVFSNMIVVFVKFIVLVGLIEIFFHI